MADVTKASISMVIQVYVISKVTLPKHSMGLPLTFLSFLVQILSTTIPYVLTRSIAMIVELYPMSGKQSQWKGVPGFNLPLWISCPVGLMSTPCIKGVGAALSATFGCAILHTLTLPFIVFTDWLLLSPEPLECDCDLPRPLLRPPDELRQTFAKWPVLLHLEQVFSQAGHSFQLSLWLVANPQ